jgi:uncharacterized heparinase superfamily protein
LRTVRHLQSRQIVGQVHNRLRRYWEKPARFAQRAIPPFPGTHEDFAPVLPPGPQRDTSAALRSGTFEFLNDAAAIGWPPDWTAVDKSKLWQYNLHYFEWLWALDYPDARDVVRDWIARHSLAKGRVGWEPYVISLRLINWTAVLFGKNRAELEADISFQEELWRSIHLQADWLHGHLEYHLLGNHFLENGATLAYLGGVFQGDSAMRWSAAGRKILAAEIPEQIPADGLHFERSPMYHLRTTYLLATLASLRQSEVDVLVREPLNRMLSALDAMCHPDGDIALLNDAAFAIYNTPAELHTYASIPATSETGPFALPDAGYFGACGDDGSYVVCDAGAIGPDYIPGHAHGDTFSFELSLRGHRVVVDSGVYDYVPSEMRSYCRSTAAHNTVEIDGCDQCEFWGAFRVARRGYPRNVRWEPGADGFTLSGYHTGYRRLSGSPEHHRTLAWSAAENRLQVSDRVTASRPVTAVSRLHLHPLCEVEWVKDCDALVRFPGGAFLVAFTSPGRLAREDSFYCPEFGRKEPTTTLAFTFEGKEAEGSFTVSLR